MLLCCAIMLVGNLETQAIGFPSFSQFNEVFTAAETDAEMRFSWFGKGVNIRNNTEAIKPLGFALARGIQFRRSEFSSRARWKVELSRGKQDGCRTWGWDFWKFVRFGQWPREYINRAGNGGFVGRGFPVVGRVNLNCAGLAALKVGNRNLVDTNIGPQLPFGGISRGDYEAPCRLPEERGKNSESQSNEREGNRCIGNCRFIPRLLVFLVSLVIALGVSCWAGGLYEQRRLLASALFGGGLLIGFVGLWWFL